MLASFYPPHGVTSQKTAFFIVTTVRTENLMSAVMTNVTFVIFTLSFVAFGLQEVQYGGHHPCTPTHKGCQMNWQKVRKRNLGRGVCPTRKLTLQSSLSVHQPFSAGIKCVICSTTNSHFKWLLLLCMFLTKTVVDVWCQRVNKTRDPVLCLMYAFVHELETIRLSFCSSVCILPSKLLSSVILLPHSYATFQLILFLCMQFLCNTEFT